MSALIIPELIEQIAAYLPIRDLAQCVRVNKTWNTLLTPILWRTIPPLPNQSPEWEVDNLWILPRLRVFFSRLVLVDYCSTHQLPPPLPALVNGVHNDSGYSWSSFPLSTFCRRVKHLDVHPFSLIIEQPLSPGSGPVTSPSPLPLRSCPKSIDLMLHLVQKCTNLQTLKMSTLHLYNTGTDGYSLWRRILLQRLPDTLKLLVIAFPSPITFAKSSVPSLLFSQCPTGLQELRFHFGYRDFRQHAHTDEEDNDSDNSHNNNNTRTDDEEERGICLLPAMKVLKVICREKDLYPSSFSRFLGRCSNLHTLHVTSIDPSWVSALTASEFLKRFELDFVSTATVRLLGTALKNGLPNLNEINLGLGGDTWEVEDIDLASMLSACRAGWRSIEVEFLGFYSADVLIKHNHCVTLEFLKMFETAERASLTSAQMVEILASSPNLHTFVTLCGIPSQYDEVPFLLADEFIDLEPSTSQLKPWLCESTLKDFRAKITGIPRPDITKTFHGYPLQDGMVLEETYLGQGQDYQRQVYQRLARLCRLERLELGYEDRYYDCLDEYYMMRGHVSVLEHRDDENYQYNCLEMSLRSGLGLMEGLKDLDVLNVMRMATSMGIEEVDWMMTSWPKLKHMTGFNYSADAEVAAQNWLYEKYPQVKLKSCGYMRD
ncbi:hypothetical protein F5H01DRAFT_342169, partial [Linnemannia elongata]